MGIPKELEYRVKDGWLPSCFIPKGWDELVIELDADINAIAPDYELNQVKEQFGGLRYYVTLPLDTPDPVREEVYRLISNAEDDATRLCILCGRTAGLVYPPEGVRRQESVLCIPHAVELYKREGWDLTV